MVDSKARSPELDEVDASWDDEDLDAGWEDPEAAADEAEGPDEHEPIGLTAEERASRAAARKERQRAKAAEKAERRKARASAAAAKQKKSAPRTSARSETVPRRRAARSVTETAEGASSLPEPRAIERDAPSPRRSFWSRGNLRGLAFPVAMLVFAGAVALVLSRR